MKDEIFGVLQRVGRSFMLPIAILPVAGLLLGIGGSFTNETMLETYGLINVMGPGTLINSVLRVLNDAGNIVFTNLPILFAIGVAIGMAKKEKEVAALSAAIAFFVMHASIGALITINGGAEEFLSGATEDVCGITSLQMGVFGGIIVGIGVSVLHNRFYKIELPQILSFFGGSRFVPIISALTYVLVGILMFFVWPVIQRGIYGVGDLVLRSGYFGTWLYGFMERLLIPFGLHHVFYIPFWQTGVGGSMEVAGQVIEGAQNIFFAQLADPTTTKFASSATRFMSGKFPLMIFGLPGAALAMYQTARSDKKKAVGGLLLSAALTAMITGITEPLEFTFLFVAPLLYGIHCVFAGVAYMLMHVFDVGVGMTFSGGLIDLFLFGIIQGNQKTNWIWIVIVGVGYFLVYYLLFTLLISKLDLKTPGRDYAEEVKLYRRSDVEGKKAKKSTTSSASRDETSELICQGLGGISNISDVDCCATRLRCTVYDSGLVRDDLLKSSGASGVIHKGNGVQIIYGPRVSVIKSHLEDYMEGAPSGEACVSQKVEPSRGKEKERNAKGSQEQETKEREAKGRETEEQESCPDEIPVYSPVEGRVDVLSKTPDEAFASGMMGPGVVTFPQTGEVRAPQDAYVSMVFDTRHAVGLTLLCGVELLIHVGIDTVELKGEGFETFVTEGQRVKKGQLLMKVDLNRVAESGRPTATPVVCPDLSGEYELIPANTGFVDPGERIFTLTRRRKSSDALVR